MAARLVSDQYGKTRVRMVKVERRDGRRHVRDLTAHVLLEGDFAEAYTEGSNAGVLPTDTMKNTVYALGKDDPIESIEAFARRLGTHFLKASQKATGALVRIEEKPWNRISVDGEAHPSAFVQGSAERATCSVRTRRDGAEVESGLEELVVLKTADSGFSGFLRDGFTTLKETSDRLFGTSVTARWSYGEADLDFAAERAVVRGALLGSFARHKSLSVQHTLFDMGQAALAACAALSKIHLSLPNRHCLLVDLAPFGLSNENEVFLPIDEPSGLIEATMVRG